MDLTIHSSNVIYVNIPDSLLPLGPILKGCQVCSAWSSGENFLSLANKYFSRLLLSGRLPSVSPRCEDTYLNVTFISNLIVTSSLSLFLPLPTPSLSSFLCA